MAAQDWTTAFEATPDGATALISEGDDRIRELKETVRTMISNEHVLETGVSEQITTQGWHRSGSAKIYVDSGSFPTTRPNGAALLNVDDTGRLLYRNDTDLVYHWDFDGWALSIYDQDLKTDQDVQFASISSSAHTSSSFSGSIIPHAIIRGTYTEDELFDLLAPFVPTVGDKVYVSGGLQELPDGTQIRLSAEGYIERDTATVLRHWGNGFITGTSSYLFVFSQPIASGSSVPFLASIAL